MKGKLIDVKPDILHALNSNERGYKLTIETPILKRKIIIYRLIDDSVNVFEKIGKDIKC